MVKHNKLYKKELDKLRYYIRRVQSFAKFSHISPVSKGVECSEKCECNLMTKTWYVNMLT